MLESDVAKVLKQECEKHGHIIRKISFEGCRDAPDYIIFSKFGRITFIECKRPKQKPRPSQRYFFDILQNYGINVFVVDSIEEAFRVIESLTNEKEFLEWYHK